MNGNIAFVWQGCSKPEIFNRWNDGLRQALRYLEDDYIIDFKEPWEDIDADVILYWEAPCTINGDNSEYYKKVMNNHGKKILLFAGGPLKKEWVTGFDLLCVESAINAKECDDLGISNITAFGINEKIFKPLKEPKKYLGIHHGTCASWKRQQLVGEALGKDGIVVGRPQETDQMPFNICRELGCTVLDQQSYEETSKLINQSLFLIQTCDFWGGGQRATLEAMACGVPVICMEDSPKNREYVEESGFGAVVYPNKEEIKKGVEILIADPLDPQIGIDYVKNKWTSKHYYEQIKKAIEKVI